MSNDKVPMTANNILKNNLEQFSLSVMQFLIIRNFYNNVTLIHLACICFLEQKKRGMGDEKLH